MSDICDMSKAQSVFNYRNLIFLSVIFVCVSMYLKWPAPATFIFSIGPLVWYHFRLNRSLGSGLSQNTIDSVYYFGFLITITTLAVTVLAVSFRGFGGDYGPIVTQFGLGLVATGYALFARMQLMSAAEKMEEGDPNAILDRYLEKVKNVVDRVEMSADAFERFSYRLTSRNQVLADEAISRAENSIKIATTAFSEQMSEIRDQFNNLNATLGDVSARLSNFDELIASSGECLLRIVTTGSDFAAAMQVAISNVEGVSTLGDEINQLHSEVNMVSRKTIEFARAVGEMEKSFGSCAVNADRSVKKIEDSVIHSSEIAGQSVKLLAENLSAMTKFIISESQKRNS